MGSAFPRFYVLCVRFRLPEGRGEFRRTLPCLLAGARVGVRQRHRLRAGYGAAALIWGKEQPRKWLLVCCDVRLAEAATKVDFDVLP